jgi:acyl-CoA reductase-like NAD-dependent aldehyde dehydrogenase
MPHDVPFVLAGRPATSGRRLDVTCPWDGALVARTWLAEASDLETAARAAGDAAPAMRALPAWRRAEILRTVARRLREEREAVARALAGEAGKPLRDALTEVDRGAMTFEVAADEARRIEGHVLPMDLAPHGEGRFAVTKRFPLGPVAAISPFNFPLNLSAHKLAPAVAAGNPVVLKPATKTPLSALRLGSVARRRRAAGGRGERAADGPRRSATASSPTSGSSCSPSPARRSSAGR